MLCCLVGAESLDASYQFVTASHRGLSVVVLWNRLGTAVQTLFNYLHVMRACNHLVSLHSRKWGFWMTLKAA